MKLLICSLYFPPCEFTPANRVYSWAKYLHKFGIYPIIITRQWPAKNTNANYFEQTIGNKVYIEKNTDYEVHYVPFLGNYSTKLRAKNNNSFCLKLVVAFELVFRYFFYSLLPYGNLFSYALEYLKNNKVDKLLITGSPFMLFKIGYLAKKKFNIPWVADYRDGWTTDNYIEEVGILTKPIKILNRYFEKKWVSTASTFTTVSDKVKIGIENYLNIKGHVVYNGFFMEDSLPIKNKTNDEINILYSGVVYENQDYQVPVKIINKLIEEYKEKVKINLLFLGTKFSNPKFENDIVFKDANSNIKLLNRVPYGEALQIHNNADVFLMLSHKGMQGIVSSKIFDYIKFHKPVILYKRDYDILDDILSKSNLGILCNNEFELEKKIRNIINEYLSNSYLKRIPNVEYINFFTRENQANALSNILKQNDVS